MIWEKLKKMLPPWARLIIGGILILFSVKSCHKDPEQITLPADTKQRVTYNENRHTLTTTTEAGTRTVYSRNPTVDLKNDGTLDVSPNSWGKEFNPIIGMGYQDTRRFYAGANVFYFRQFDLYGAFGVPMDNGHVALKANIGVSWNFWRNCSLNIGANPVPVILHERPEIGGFVSVRL